MQHAWAPCCVYGETAVAAVQDLRSATPTFRGYCVAWSQAFQQDSGLEYQIDTGAFFLDNAPSWAELQQLVEQRMQETGGS